MKSLRAPLIVLGLSLLIFFAFTAWSTTRLPDRVATHFNFAGDPSGWMSRNGHLVFWSLFGVLFPCSMAGVFAAVRLFPVSMINLPNRDYWLAEERQAETFRYLLRHGLWFACLASLFCTGLSVAMYRANVHDPPRLSNQLVWGVAGVFLVGVVAWIVVLVLHFRRGAE